MVRSVDLIAKHVVEFSMCIAYESYQNGDKEKKEMQISLTWQSLQSRKQCGDLSSPHKVRPTLVRSDEKVWASPACHGCAPFLELICSAPLPHYPAFSHPKVPQQCFTKETSEVIREVLLKALIPMCVEVCALQVWEEIETKIGTYHFTYAI